MRIHNKNNCEAFTKEIDYLITEYGNVPYAIISKIEVVEK